MESNFKSARLSVHFILFFCTFFGELKSQIIHNLDGGCFGDKPFFDTAFIHRNHIQEIRGTYSIKKDGDIVRDVPGSFVYRFDSLGRLVLTMDARTFSQRQDTLWNRYKYDRNGNLMLHQRSDEGGFTTTEYRFDSINRVVGVEQRREIVDSNGLIVQSTILNRETMKYQKYALGERKTVYNNYNLPYMEETELRNKEGYLLEHTQRLRMANSDYRKQFVYGEKGLPVKVLFIHNTEEPYEEWQFRYDKFGNVIEKLTLRNNKINHNLQIIYDSQTGLLGSTIQKHGDETYLLILRFKEYSYIR
ncbi:MAG: hypothetical protein RL264_3013 [Bacteroidota bacterium]